MAGEDLRFPDDLLVEDFGDPGALAFRLSDRVPKLLNPSAALALEALRGGAPAEEAAARIAGAFDVPLPVARRDLDALLEALADEGLLGRGTAPAGIPPLPADWRDALEDTMAENEPVADGAGETPPIPETAVPVLSESEVILREEEEGAFLFEPESGNLSCLNPVGILVWKAIDGQASLGAIADAIAGRFEDVDRDTVLGDVRAFLAELKTFGYADWT
jgi:hypothetical protein